MNPEEVQKWYFQTLEKMLGGEDPQDRRTALAELGKVFRQGEDEKAGIIEKLTEQLKEATECIMENSKDFYDYRKRELIKTLDKTNIPITRGLLRDVGITEEITEPTPHEERAQGFKASGKWPENMVVDINRGRTELQSMGFIKMEPILLVEDALYEIINGSAGLYLPYKSWVDAAQQNGLITTTVKTKISLGGNALLISMDVDFDNALMLPLVIATVSIKNIET
jgi:hypothetical protein